MPRVTLYVSDADMAMLDVVKAQVTKAPGGSVSSLVIHLLRAYLEGDRQACPHVTCHVCKRMEE